MACIVPAAAGGERGAAGGVPRRAAPEHEDDADAAEGDEHGAHQDVDHENVPLGRPRDALHRARVYSLHLNLHKPSLNSLSCCRCTLHD